MIAYLPQLKKIGVSDDGKEAAARGKALQHSALNMLFRECFSPAFGSARGIILPGTSARGHVRLSLIVGDLKEMWRTFDLTASARAHYPCAICEVGRDEAYRTPMTARARSTARAIRYGSRFGYGIQSGSIAHQILGVDPYSSFFPDMLHCAELGLMRTILGKIVGMLRKDRQSLSTFDQRMQRIPTFYGLRLPRYGASRSAAKHERGQPLRSIFGVLPFVIEGLVPSPVMKVVITFISHYSICRQLVISRTELAQLRDLGHRLIQQYVNIGSIRKGYESFVPCVSRLVFVYV